MFITQDVTLIVVTLVAVLVGVAMTMKLTRSRRAAPSISTRNIVITGSTRGFGYALAAEFLNSGDNVMICGRDLAQVELKCSELQQLYPSNKVVGRVCDVTKHGDVVALADQAVQEFGYVDIWINNAGLSQSPNAKLVNTPSEAIADIVYTNVLGTLYGYREAFRVLLSHPRPDGAMQHVFGMDGAGSNGMTTAEFATYGVTKAGLPQLQKSLVAEMKGTHVGVHMLSPGMMLTDLLLKGSSPGNNVLPKRTKWIFNILCEKPETVAAWMVPKVRAVTGTGTYKKFLTPADVAWRFATAWRRKNRFFQEEN